MSQTQQQTKTTTTRKINKQQHAFLNASANRAVKQKNTDKKETDRERETARE